MLPLELRLSVQPADRLGREPARFWYTAFDERHRVVAQTSERDLFERAITRHVRDRLDQLESEAR